MTKKYTFSTLITVMLLIGLPFITISSNNKTTKCNPISDMEELTSGKLRFQQHGESLDAIISGTGYQFIDSDDRSFITSADSVYSITANGAYALVVTNTCVDTAKCQTILVVGMGDDENPVHITVQPNVLTGQFTIYLKTVTKARIEVIDKETTVGEPTIKEEIIYVA